MDVVNSADYNGSTEYIREMIANAPAGSKWAIGTEISLVNRLAAENPDKLVFCLDSVICPCSTMYRIHPAYLSWVLDGLNEGVVVTGSRWRKTRRERPESPLTECWQWYRQTGSLSQSKTT